MAVYAAMKATPVIRKTLINTLCVELRSRAAHDASKDTANAALDLDAVNAEHQVEQANVALDPRPRRPPRRAGSKPATRTFSKKNYQGLALQ